jgi:Trp operon repressor
MIGFFWFGDWLYLHSCFITRNELDSLGLRYNIIGSRNEQTSQKDRQRMLRSELETFPTRGHSKNRGHVKCYWKTNSISLIK